ncbi:accessory gene regulator ArgB-like protein [Clostridium sp.]|uniref:accessory gene regulator ArgB-like protein n=1 Tax=Clostridium sp. TaxID=1506 RepID=UPI002603D5CA|nr:accessory gene regulator B family protein [Clostridium sp.]
MFSVEKICEKISKNIAKELNFDDDKRDIVNYGIFAFIQTGICIAMVIIFGLIFNVTIEALIISFIISILRKSSGGVHASSPGRCAIIGTIICVGLAMISKKIYIDFFLNIFWGSIVFVWSYYIVYKLAPVDSIAKPIKTIEKKTRLKKNSIKILTVYLIIVIINSISYFYIRNIIFLTFSMCIYMGSLWQVFTLTRAGHALFEHLKI